MTVARLREEMSNAEFMEWCGFLRWEADQVKKKGSGRGR
jgi:hypothetical protein